MGTASTITSAEREERYAALSARVHRHSAYHVSNNHDAEDVTQRVLLRIVAGEDEGRSEKPAGYYSEAVRRLAISNHRDTARQKRHNPELYHRQQNPLGELTPEDAEVINLLEDALVDSLNTLKPELRAAVMDHYAAGLSYKQIAEKYEITTTRVRNRLHRARTQLKRELARRVEGIEELLPSVSGQRSTYFSRLQELLHHN